MEQYHVNIENFEGPLDLLLHLIRNAEIDIQNIFVSEITSQYLDYMQQLDRLDMDRASEFLTMAATLLYIKSKNLLPEHTFAEEEEEEDPEQTLIRQLQEYKAIKEVSSKLQNLMEDASGSVSRYAEDVTLPPQKIFLKDTSIDLLYASFQNIMSRIEYAEKARKSRNVHHDSYTVRKQTLKIREALTKTEKKRIKFEDLFDEAVSKMEVVVTFMALLDMISNGEVHIRQNKLFSPIFIQIGNLLDEDENISYMDEIQDGE